MSDPPQVASGRHWLVWIFSVLGFGFLVCLFWPISSQGSPIAPQLLCFSNLKGIAAGVALYASDNNDTLPTANWHNAIAHYTLHKCFSCPEVEMQGKLGGFAYNKQLVGIKSKMELDDHRILFFETATLGLDVVEDPVHLLAIPRHSEARSLIHMDCSVERVKPGDSPK